MSLGQHKSRGFLSLVALLITAAVIIVVVVMVAKSVLQSRQTTGSLTPSEAVDRARWARDLIENRY